VPLSRLICSNVSTVSVDAAGGLRLGLTGRFASFSVQMPRIVFCRITADEANITAVRSAWMNIRGVYTSTDDYTLKAYYISQRSNFWDFMDSHRSTRSVFSKAINAPNSFSAGTPPRSLLPGWLGSLEIFCVGLVRIPMSTHSHVSTGENAETDFFDVVEFNRSTDVEGGGVRQWMGDC